MEILTTLGAVLAERAADTSNALAANFPHDSVECELLGLEEEECPREFLLPFLDLLWLCRTVRQVREADAVAARGVKRVQSDLATRQLSLAATEVVESCLREFYLVHDQLRHRIFAFSAIRNFENYVRAQLALEVYLRTEEFHDGLVADLIDALLSQGSEREGRLPNSQTKWRGHHWMVIENAALRGLERVVNSGVAA